MIDPRLPRLEAARELLCVTSSLSKNELGGSRTPFPGLLGNVDWRSGGKPKAKPASVNRSGSANRLDTGLSWSWSRGELTGCVNQQRISRDADLAGWGLSSKARDRLAHVHSGNQGGVTEVLRGCEPKGWPRQRVLFGIDIAGGGRRDGGLTSRNLEQLGCGGMVGGCTRAGSFGRPGGGGTGKGHFGWDRGEAKPEGTLDSPQRASGDLGGAFVLLNLGQEHGLSGAQREVPLDPEREVDRDASPSQDPWEGPEETFALLNTGPKDDICSHLSALLRREPLAIVGAPLDGYASAAGLCGRLERSSKASKVVESSLGPEGAAWEVLLPAALQTSSVLADGRGHSRSSRPPPAGLEQLLGGRDGCKLDLRSEMEKAHFCDGVRGGKPLKKDSDTGVAAEWALSNKLRNRLAHAYNGNTSQTCNFTRQELNAKQDKAQAARQILLQQGKSAGEIREILTTAELRLIDGKCEKSTCPAEIGDHRDGESTGASQDVAERLQELMRRLEVQEKQTEERQKELRALAVLTTAAVDRHALSPVESLSQGGSQDSEGRRQTLEDALRTAQRLREAGVTRPPSQRQGVISPRSQHASSPAAKSASCSHGSKAGRSEAAPSIEKTPSQKAPTTWNQPRPCVSNFVLAGFEDA